MVGEDKVLCLQPRCLLRHLILRDCLLQAFPCMVFERRGMPVIAFTRCDEKPIREKTQIYTPDCLMVIDPTLLELPTLFDGLKPGGVLILNSDGPMDHQPSENLEKTGWINATQVALEEIGRDIPNTCLIGAFARITGWVSLESIKEALGDYLQGSILEKNLRNAERGYNEVEVQTWDS